MKTAVPDPGVADCRLPGGFYLDNRVAFVGEDEPFLPALCEEKRCKAFGKWDFAPLAAGGFGAGDEEQLPRPVDVFPPLVEKFAAAHARIDGRDNNRAEVRGGTL